MKIGFLGLPNSGKTTIFNALTKSEAEVSAYVINKAEPNIATVDIVDDRITTLSHMYQPKKTTYATMEIVDFVGFTEGSARKDIISTAQMSLIRTMDAIALVARNFANDLTGDSTPVMDVETINTELILSDLMITEKRLERIEWNFKRGKKTVALETEERVLRKIHEELNNNRHVNKLDLNKEEKQLISGFQFLTQKPIFVILNSGEDNFGRNDKIIEELEKGYGIIEFSGHFEMELSRLNNDEDAALFMEDMKITESACSRITRFAYEALGYISFITVGTDEVRAWTIHNGDTAVDAAGTIHSDLSRGFIRAECFSYHDLIEYGSEKGVRDGGHLRLEGKNYRVKDGDILNIRFNV
jgi:hypothetical protein